MYYQVKIEIPDKSSKTGIKEMFELDKTDLTEIKQDIIVPFLNKDEFQFDGYFVNPRDVKRLLIKETILLKSTQSTKTIICRVTS